MMMGMSGLLVKVGGLGRALTGVIGLAALMGVAILGWTVARNDLAAEAYRERLAGLSAEYEALRGRYNEVVRRSAVTELIVEEGGLSVRVVAADGRERLIPTDLDPSGEVYVDYVVLDGRLWIRRLFDERTPPLQGVVIDPRLATVGWSGERGEIDAEGLADAGAPPLEARVGKAVYRRLGEGRWIVTVTGNGSLGLERAAEGERPRLLATPEVRDFDEMDEEVRARLDAFGPIDMLGRLVGGGAGAP